MKILVHVTMGSQDLDMLGMRVPSMADAETWTSLAGGDVAKLETHGAVLFIATRLLGAMEDAGTQLQAVVDGMPAVSLAGVKGSLSPAGDEVIAYAGPNDLPDTALEATSERGWGDILHVEEGDYTLTVETEDATCSWGGPLGWAGTAPNTLRVKAMPGYLTHYNTVVCD